MVQFEYDGVMKRYNVKVPFTLAGESSMINIASISEGSIIIDVDASHISKNFGVKLKNIPVSPEAVTTDFNISIRNKINK